MCVCVCEEEQEEQEVEEAEEAEEEEKEEESPLHTLVSTLYRSW